MRDFESGEWCLYLTVNCIIHLNNNVSVNNLLVFTELIFKNTMINLTGPC